MFDVIVAGRIEEWFKHAGAEELSKFIELARERMEQLDCCEHGVQAGNWCGLCHEAYKTARRENGMEED